MDNQLAAALRSADEERLTALANKGIYKRAVKDAEKEEAAFTEYDTSVEVETGGEKCVITVPLEQSRCSCPSRTVCRHIITAILLLKRQLPDSEEAVEEKTQPEDPENAEVPERTDEKPEKSKPPAELTERELEKVRRCAKMCNGLLCGIITHGLVRIPETAAEDFELAAVRCHGTGMAECERLVRGLGGRIADCVSRRASFDIRSFTDRMLETAEHIGGLMRDDAAPDDLGSFRSVYENVEGYLELLPVGQRTIAGGEFEGDVFYFVNTAHDAKQRFLTFSDIRPTFYETGRSRRMEVRPWGLGTSLRSMMKQRMTLSGAKVCNGKLSASKETIVAAHSAAVLDCSFIHSLMVTDFREIVLRLSERSSERETDRLFFIYPKRMVRYGFDKNEQKLIITFEDMRGCSADCVVKYSSESKKYIEQLERICKKMADPSKRVYTLLVTAYIENGRLYFFPIDVYDFINPLAVHEFEMPPEAEKYAEEGIYAQEINRHIGNVRGLLTSIVQSDLQSELDCSELIAESRRAGMEGLAQLIGETADAAENCRHSLTDGSYQVLEAMRRLNRYIKAAEERTSFISALSELEKTKYITGGEL